MVTSLRKTLTVLSLSDGWQHYKINIPQEFTPNQGNMGYACENQGS